MKIMEYEVFETLLNKRLFEGSHSKLMKNISEKPERFLGLFRPTTPKTKLIQNITQSHEIRFGDALEEIFAIYFEKFGFLNLDKHIIGTNGKNLRVDQLFTNDDTIFMIEQKVRDDHDSTKKSGQFRNFENKYFEITKLCQGRKIVPIMWFVDDSLVKNKSYYLQEMKVMNEHYGSSAILCYGKELFNLPELDIVIWYEVLEHLRNWKESLPDMPEINLDKNSCEVFEQLKNLKPIVWRKLFSNADIKEAVLPILFPNGKTLSKVVEYIKENETQKIWVTIADLIETWLKEGEKR